MPKTEHAIDWRMTAAEISAEYTRMADENERLRKRLYVNEIEYAATQFRYGRAVNILSGIHALLYPPTVTDDDGNRWAFRSPILHEQMQALSDLIRAIPDEITAIEASIASENVKQKVPS